MIIKNTEGGYFKDQITGEQYRRIMAGLAWPGVRPGFIAVIGENFLKDSTLQVRLLRLLGEAEDADINGLLRKAVDLWGRFSVEEFLGDSQDKPMMDFLWQFNERLAEKGIPRLYLQAAPHVDDPRSFTFYATKVKTHLARDRKTLHLGEGSKLGGYLQELPPEEILKASALDFPAIAALGYVIAYLDSWQPRPDTSNWRDKARKGTWRTA